ncbi:MAG: hypothetical protein QOE08_2246 [Thermoleophilaceae bacterium]|jgi:RNA polymerase sigma-70 factor (ECF subfamily)|nr:hypothetical protein [Thermoleophilaceae bacterium]
MPPPAEQLAPVREAPRLARPQPLLSDETLMLHAQRGDADAFGRLHDRHAARAIRVALAVCGNRTRAEDAVQEGFLSIWRSRASYRPESGSFQGWAMKIIHNRAIDANRRDAASRRPQLVAIEDAAAAPAPGSLQDAVIARSEGDALRAMLRGLPDTQAEVIVLAYFGELSHSEIAAQLSLPAGTVKGRMRLGLHKLRDELELRDPAFAAG